MRKLNYTSVLLLLLIAAFSSTLGHSETVEDLKTKNIILSKLFQQGMYEEPETLKIANEILSLTENFYGSDHNETANALNNLALIYIVKKHYAEAEKLSKRALEIYETIPGQGSPCASNSYGLFEEIYKKTGRFAEATVAHKKMADIQMQAGGKEIICGALVPRKTLGPGPPPTAGPKPITPPPPPPPAAPEIRSGEEPKLIWNVWAERKTARYDPLEKLEKDREYRIVLDLSALVYKLPGVEQVPPSSDLEEEIIKIAKDTKDRFFDLVAFVLPDTTYFDDPVHENRVKAVDIDLNKIRKYRSAVMEDMWQDIKINEEKSKYVFGHEAFLLKTRENCNDGWASVAIVLFRNRRPVDEVKTVFCVGNCENIPKPEIPAVSSALHVLSEKSTPPDGSLYLLEFDRNKLVGLFGDGSSDFHVDEFKDGYTIKALCDKLRVDGFALTKDTSEELNELLKKSDLYNKIKQKKNNAPSERLKKLEESYAREKNDDNLIKINRSAIEEYYPKETPKSPYYVSWEVNTVEDLKAKIGERFKELNKIYFKQDIENTGNTLMQNIFGDETQEAYKAFMAFVRKKIKDKQESKLRPSLFVRVVTSDNKVSPFIPMGLLLITDDKEPNKSFFLGEHFRVISPLPIRQSYSPGRKCISNSVAFLPPAGATHDKALEDAIKGMADSLDKLGVEQQLNSRKDIDEYLKSVRNAGSSLALLILSHHSRDKIWFTNDINQYLAPGAFRYRFGSPSIAILNACETSATDTNEFVDRLNEKGMDAVIATASEVKGYMNGRFFYCLNTEMQKRNEELKKLEARIKELENSGTKGQEFNKLKIEIANEKAYPISQIFHDTLMHCLWGDRDSANNSFDANALRYVFLGNGDLTLCIGGKEKEE